uniref:Oxidation resistance protein 1 n=1 Tax=Globisporangium ultimum (strain ATCC 200006 / CBS 805.95 / DAOM BR144) TaxID=431595 RepID=K3WGT4_GLOUD
MLGKLSHWLSAKLELEDKEDDSVRLRFDALTRMKKTTLDVVQTANERLLTDDTVLDENSEAAEGDTTSAALENCLKLGLKPQSNQDISLWNVLYSSSLVVDEPDLVQSIQTAALLSDTDAGKARCWLKIALNKHALESTLLLIFSVQCDQVIRSSYEEWALMRCCEGMGLFLQMVMDIRNVHFAIRVNDDPFQIAEPKETPTVPIAGAPDGVEDSATATTNTDTTNELTEEVTVSADKLTNAVDSAIADEEFVEVSSMFFPHRHKGIKPWQYVFGVGISYLAKNPYHSRFALIDPVLAIPNIVQDCIDFLMENPDSPRLFRATVLNVHINQLREIVETDGALPPDLDAPAAGAILMDFFKNLPEPLLTSEKYEAFIASGRLRDEEASIRNITCLVQDMPVCGKFVLEKVIGLMHFLLSPEHTEHNGLDIATASTTLAPVIAFKKEPSKGPLGQRRSTHSQHQDVRYAAVGAQVVERMIKHYDVIFQDVRVQVSDALTRLEAKKSALLSIYQLFKMKPQVNFLSDKQYMEEITKAFTENTRSDTSPPQSPNNPDKATTTSVPKVTSPLRHRTVTTSNPFQQMQLRAVNGLTTSLNAAFDRSVVEIWEKHGFNRPTLLDNFDKGGVLLLRSVAYMLKNDSDVLQVLYTRALPSAAPTYDAGLVSSAICESLINLLKLVPSPEHPSINIVALSTEPFWELFDEEAYFYKLFSLMFRIFDQLWDALDPEEASFTRVFCDTEAKLNDLLGKSPSSVEDVRNEWEELWKLLTDPPELGEDGDEEGGSTEDEASQTSPLVAPPPSPPRISKKPSFTFRAEDYKTKLMNPSSILTLDQVAYLDNAIPITCQLCRWCLLYSTETNGSSLHTLLVLTRGQSPTLLVIKDDQGNVFGGFGSDEWHRATQYYGNGETFLFSFANHKGSNNAGFTKYPWSRRNSYFMLCSEESLVMGGGGSFGLYLDSDLASGTTGACETFSSRPLVSAQEFSCVHVEVWGFTTGDKPIAQKDPRKKSVLD